MKHLGTTLLILTLIKHFNTNFRQNDTQHVVLNLNFRDEFQYLSEVFDSYLRENRESNDSPNYKKQRRGRTRTAEPPISSPQQTRQPMGKSYRPFQ